MCSKEDTSTYRLYWMIIPWIADQLSKKKLGDIYRGHNLLNGKTTSGSL